MSTSETVRERALTLAQAGSVTEEAIEELLEACKGKRVPVVLAHQQLLGELEGSSDPVVSEAAELLDRVIARLPRD